MASTLPSTPPEWSRVRHGPWCDSGWLDTWPMDEEVQKSVLERCDEPLPDGPFVWGKNKIDALIKRCFPWTIKPHLSVSCYLRSFLAGWLNQVRTLFCQSLWKWGFKIMPFRLGAMIVHSWCETNGTAVSTAPCSAFNYTSTSINKVLHGRL